MVFIVALYIYMYIYIVSNYTIAWFKTPAGELGSCSQPNLWKTWCPDHEWTTRLKRTETPQILGGEISLNSVHLHPKTSWFHDPMIQIWLAHMFQMGGKNNQHPQICLQWKTWREILFRLGKSIFLKLSSEKLVSLYTLRKNLKDVSRNHVRHPHRWHRNRYFNILFYDVFITVCLKFWLRLHPQIIPNEFKRCQWQDVSAGRILGLDWKIIRSCFLFLLTDASLLPCTHLSIIFAMFIRISYLQWHTQHDVHCLSCWPPQIMISYDLYIFDVFCWSLWTLQICVPHTFSRGKFTNPCSLPRFVFEYFCRSFESLWEMRYYSGSHCIVPRRKGGWGMVFVYALIKRDIDLFLPR